MTSEIGEDSALAERLGTIADPMALLLGLFAHAPVAFQIFQPDGRSLLVNRAFRDLFGSEPPPAYRIFEDDIAERLGLLPLIRRAFAGQTVHVPAFWYDPRELTKVDVQDGRRVAIEMTMFPLLGANRVIGHVAMSFKDVTSRMELEEAAAALSRSERVASETRLQDRQIQEANRLKSEFLANMSHELRTPLNAIIGFAELIFDGQVDPASPQHHEFMGDILASGKHLLQLINDVLDLAKVEAGKVEFRPEPVSPAKLVGEVCAILRSTVAGKNLSIKTDVDATLTEIIVDPSRLKQILYNFLSNALKFTPEGGRVVVRVRQEGPDKVRVEVEDTGIGIAASDIARLFTEFQQLDGGAAKKHQGTGLGLALARRLVEAQGGTVGVKSVLGEGSTFHAILPRRAQAVVPCPPLVPGHSALRAPVVRAGVPSVLVVEDDPTDRALIVGALRDAGYGVEIAATGAEALARCAERAFEAITLDLLLPDMSGLDLLAAIRAAGHNKKAPVIVVTVVAEARTVAAFAVHDVLGKPLDVEGLLASLVRAGVKADVPGGVLVVDDDAAALRLTEASLARIGYPSICRSDGPGGLEVASTRDLIAVVVDLIMPGMDGFEFVERLRAIPRHARTPLFVWTIKDLTADEKLRLQASAQGVIAKGGPGASALLGELRAFLSMPTEQAR